MFDSRLPCWIFPGFGTERWPFCQVSTLYRQLLECLWRYFWTAGGNRSVLCGLRGSTEESQRIYSSSPLTLSPLASVLGWARSLSGMLNFDNPRDYSYWLEPTNVLCTRNQTAGTAGGKVCGPSLCAYTSHSHRIFIVEDFSDCLLPWWA